MPTQSDPKPEIRPPTGETPEAPRSDATDTDDGGVPLLPFGEDPGTIGVDDPTVE